MSANLSPQVSLNRGGKAASSDSGLQREAIQVALTLESKRAPKRSQTTFMPEKTISNVKSTSTTTAA